MAINNPALINGIAYSFVDIRVNINGVQLASVSAINYEETSEFTNNYGAGQRPTSRGASKIEATASMTIDRADFNALLDGSAGNSLFNIPPFDIIVSYAPEGQVPRVDTIKNVQFTRQGSGGAVDDTNTLIELEMLPSHILFNSNS